jgi:uncharacterized membrane protein YhaH (DUF805 family)
MKALSRGKYLLLGVAFMALKYAGDALLVEIAVGRAWLPSDYVRSLFLRLSPTLDPSPSWLLWAMGAWALPFIIIGVRLTMRRAIDAAWSPWIALIFFVPYLNYLLMLVLCFAPSRPINRFEPAIPAIPEPGATDDKRAFLTAVLAGAAIGVAMIAFGVYAIRSYGSVLFLGTPFVMGVMSAFALRRMEPDSSTGRAYRAAAFAILVVGGGLLLIALEGLACLVMAAPLALVLAVAGAAAGCLLAGNRDNRVGGIGLGLIALPLAAALEPAVAPPPVAREVLTIVEIAAPPERVWPVVVAFPPMAEPTDWLRRAGIAYPRAARIDGAGVGAIRYCEFSTGAFVEPITAWEPGRRLAFDVTASPPALRELSLYANVQAPHLDGYLRSRRGEFRLVALPGGRTRLEGRTWYEIDMGPEWYWRLWADWMIHGIHRRVLEHIKTEVE